MTIDRTTRVFFDASCLIAAAGSPTGGSGFLLSVCARRLLRPIVSQFVLYEAEHNIQQKRGHLVLRAYHALLISVPFAVISVPNTTTIASGHSAVNAKNIHVVASVLASETPYLLTLWTTQIKMAHKPVESVYRDAMVRGPTAAEWDASGRRPAAVADRVRKCQHS